MIYTAELNGMRSRLAKLRDHYTQEGIRIAREIEEAEAIIAAEEAAKATRVVFCQMAIGLAGAFLILVFGLVVLCADEVKTRRTRERSQVVVRRDTSHERAIVAKHTYPDGSRRYGHDCCNDGSCAAFGEAIKTMRDK